MKITLNGYVVADEDQWLYDWFGISAFSPAIVRKAVQDNPDGEDLIFEINSGGGSVFAGFEMYSVLRSANCRTVAHVQSIAGSAASTVMEGCTRVMLSPVAQVMIHLPMSRASGNQNDFRHEAKVLDSITQSILNVYELRSNGKATRDRLEKLMRAESWLTAQEAVALGLADGILFQDEHAVGCLPENIVNAVGGGIRSIANNSYTLDKSALLSRYEKLVANGAEPALGHPVAAQPLSDADPKLPSDVWQREARLAIEKNRFLKEENAK